jgi:hypothetical protein
VDDGLTAEIESFQSFFRAPPLRVPFGEASQFVLDYAARFADDFPVRRSVSKQFTFAEDVPDLLALGDCSDLLRIFHTVISVKKPNSDSLQRQKINKRNYLKSLNETLRIRLTLFPMFLRKI